MCRTPRCGAIHKGSLFEYRCLRCAIHAFPDRDFPQKRCYKTKERLVVDKICAMYDFTWRLDKRVEGGCTLLRPDLFCDFGSHTMIVEIDENSHRSYPQTCEIARLNEIAEDLAVECDGHKTYRPIVVLRFNPDAYTDEIGRRVPSCFKLLGNGHLVVADAAVWQARLDALLARIRAHVDTPPQNLLEIEHLFYDHCA